MTPEPDGMFTDRRGKVPASRALYLAFLVVLSFGCGFGLGYIA